MPPMSGGRRRHVATAVSFLLGGMLLTGCGSLDLSDDASVPEAAPVATQPAGTPITDWLSVPRGAVLLGSVFPDQRGGVRALMLVTGDALEAVTDLAEQAYKAEYHWVPPDGDHGVCEVQTGEHWTEVLIGQAGDDDTYPVDAELPDGPRWLFCEGAGYRPVEQGFPWSVYFRLIVGSEPDPYLAHLLVQVAESTLEEGQELIDAPLEIPDVPAPVTPPPYPASMSGLEEDIGAPFSSNDEEYPLLEGSQLTAPPFWNECSGGGFYAVLELEEADIDDYIYQYRPIVWYLALYGDGAEEYTYGEAQVVYHAFYSFGIDETNSGALGLLAVEYPDGSTYMLVDRCYM